MLTRSTFSGLTVPGLTVPHLTVPGRRRWRVALVGGSLPRLPWTLPRYWSSSLRSLRRTSCLSPRSQISASAGAAYLLRFSELESVFARAPVVVHPCSVGASVALESSGLSTKLATV